MFQNCENGNPLKSQAAAAMNKCAVKNWIPDENVEGCKFPTARGF